MKKVKLYFLSIILLTTLNSVAQKNKVSKIASIDNLAPTPPLGYNSWDSYLYAITEDKASALIDVMAEKYLPFGYEYFVIDAGWYYNIDFYEGTQYPKDVIGPVVDEYGMPDPWEITFPNGIKALASKAHKKGLKFGVWFIRGIPKLAVERNLPIKGTKYTARDIADTTNTCGWNNICYGIDMNKPGAQEYYNALIDKLASWGVDYIKVDDVVPNPKEIVAVANAIKNGGHKMIYSLSPGERYSKKDLAFYRKANVLRITEDIWDHDRSLRNGFVGWEKAVGIEGNGFWPDLDMIPFGRLCVGVPEGITIKKEDKRSRQSRFSKDQMQTFITQRALAASPLMIGGDLLTMDDYSYSLLTNKTMLECNQNGVVGVKVYSNDDVEVWYTPNKDNPSKGWIGIFNRHENHKIIRTLSKKELGFTEIYQSYHRVGSKSDYKLKDIWNNEEFVLEGEHDFEIQPNGVLFLEFQEVD